MSTRRWKFRHEVRLPGLVVGGVAICCSIRNNLARTNVLLSSHMLLPHLILFLPAKPRGAFWLSKHDIFHPSIILLLGSTSKERITGQSREQVIRSLIFCTRHKTTEKKKGIKTKPNQHQRYIRSRILEKSVSYLNFPKLREQRKVEMVTASTDMPTTRSASLLFHSYLQRHQSAKPSPQ